MVLRHVERREIIPLGLDFRPLGDREAEVGEDLREFVHHLAHRVDRTREALRRRERKIDFFRYELPLQLRVLERGLGVR